MPLSASVFPSEVVEIDADAPFISRNLRTIRRTYRAIRVHNPDVILLDSRELMGTLIALVSVICLVPVVFRFKGNYWEGLAESYLRGGRVTPRGVFRYLLSRLANAMTYALADGFVVVSRELARVVMNRTGCAPDRVAVVHVPIESGRIEGSASVGRERLGVTADQIVLTVTNLTYPGKYRGVRTALHGLLPVLREDPDVAYVVAGGGPYHEVLEASIDQTVGDSELRRRIHTPGFVKDIADLYAMADAVVYLSHIDGYPRVVIEAQLAGVPVVSNAAYGMLEQIDHGRTGLLLDPPTPGGVERAVRQLLSDPDERRRLGENGRERVHHENNPTAIARQLEEALVGILQATGRQ